MPDSDDTYQQPPLEQLPAGSVVSPPRSRKPLWIAIICLLVLLAGTTFAFYAKSHGYNALAPFLPSPDLTQVFGKPNLRILVMGLDENWSNSDEVYTAGARTDTLLGVNIDLANKQVNVLSIPRDVWVYIPKSGYGKINEAFGDGGPLRTEATVVKNFATPPFDYYLVLKIDATKNIVDALGGLDVNVEKNMDYDDSWGHLHIHLKKGMHHLNGDEVVGYIRFRHDPEGDLGRMRRQRQVIQILAHRLRDPSVALHLPALLSIFKDNVRTDMPVAKMYDLALGMRDVTPQMVHSASCRPSWVGSTASRCCSRPTWPPKPWCTSTWWWAMARASIRRPSTCGLKTDRARPALLRRSPICCASAASTSSRPATPRALTPRRPLSRVPIKRRRVKSQNSCPSSIRRSPLGPLTASTSTSSSAPITASSSSHAIRI